MTRAHQVTDGSRAVPDLPEVRVTPKPSVRHQAKALTKSLAAWVLRRPCEADIQDAVRIKHSSEVRQVVMVLTLTEIPLAFLVSRIVPPPARPAHAALEILLILLGFSILATMARHPHTVSSSAVALRTGFLGDIVLPRESVRSAARSMRTIEGRGLRRVPDDPSALACSIGASVNVVIRLDTPVLVDLRDGGPIEVRTVHISADSPDEVSRALRGGDATGRSGGDATGRRGQA
ncbi:hypothetical protein AB0F39_13545 [Streptomyces murinus]|uniref:hypothetical protein n=1 Tax=Streptomyces murinus TaxID=33900 RepID=UPI00340E8422